MFGKSNEDWKELNGYNTANEINQQPKLWEEVLDIMDNSKNDVIDFLKDRTKEENLRVIFTGAGTSAYVGEIVTPYLNKREDMMRYEAIATTDIVDNPDMFLKKDTPTIIVSFARSGNSPESVAVYDLANKIVDDISHIFITCNAEGELAKISEKDTENTLLILMPEESNDKGFAMTGSFSCMTLSALLTFSMDQYEETKKDAKKLIEIAKNVLENSYKDLKPVMEKDFNRVVYLGAGTYYGLAKESGLKLLELTRGQIISLNESPLGYRHGPKSIMNDETLVISYISEDKYSKKYDLDLLNENFNNLGDHTTISITQRDEKEINEISDYNFNLGLDKIMKNEILVALGFALFAQVISLEASIKTGIEPDNPNPSGLVNRVVEGVTIHKYSEEE